MENKMEKIKNYQEKLTDLLDRNSKMYYEKNTSELTDTEFDSLFKKLSEVEFETGNILPNSPTLRLGNDMQKEFKKINHPKDNPMYTIDNTYDDHGLEEWFLKYFDKHDFGNGKRLVLSIEPKYDGISAELHYHNGLLKSVSTRGDKNTGDDITAGARTIKSIPLSISTIANGKSFPDIFVRGEILLPAKALDKINKERKSEGLKPFSNCRNACSGSIKQLNPMITRKRNLIFRPWDVFFYEIPEDNSKVLKRNEIYKYHSDKFDFLKDNHFEFEMYPEQITLLQRNSSEALSGFVRKYHDTMKGKKDSVKSLVYSLPEKIDPLPYDCDGVVIKLDDISYQDRIGTKDNRAIEWAIARKWNEENEVISILDDVDFQVGRTGNITPVGKLEPVFCDGVMITNVMLNNESFISQMGLKKNIPVKIVRSGSVIPYCTGISSWDEYFKRNNISKDNFKIKKPENIEFPKKCPECGSLLVKTGEIWKCPDFNCPAQEKGRILLWCSKPCMDISDIGPAVVNDLYEKMKIHNPFGLYDLLKMDNDEILKCLGEGYGEKTIINMKEELTKSIGKPYLNVLTSLGISNIGKENARLLISRFPSLELLMNATVDEISVIPGFAQKTAEGILEWFRKHGNFAYKAIKDINLITYNKTDKTALGEEKKALEGLSIIFTGKSEYFKGDEVEDFLSENGGNCSHSVSGKTDYLILGDKPGGSKVSKAEKLNVKIIPETEFYKKFNIMEKIKG